MKHALEKESLMCLIYRPTILLLEGLTISICNYCVSEGKILDFNSMSARIYCQRLLLFENIIVMHSFNTNTLKWIFLQYIHVLTTFRLVDILS